MTGGTVLLISQVVDGFIIDARARKLSENTIRDYSNTYRKFIASVGDVEIADITADDVRRFMASLTDLRAKTVRNYHMALSSLWGWSVENKLASENVIRRIKPPRPDSRIIQPFTEADVRSLIRASAKIEGERNGKTYTYRSHNARRNKAIILFLLDTGVRASELCDLKVSDVDLSNARVRIMGKGRRERLIDFSPITAKSIWRYVTDRKAAAGDWLFVSDEGRKLERGGLGKFLRNIGRRAKVPDCHPHRFRHTFAVMSLMNGVDPYTLQVSLGHSSMEMVRRYLNVAQVDSARLQRKASPVGNLVFSI